MMACEVLLLIDRGEKTWECLVRPGRKMRPGAKLSFGNGELTAEVVGEVEGGNRLVRFDYEGIFLDCSYGFRPGRSCHDVVRYLNHTVMTKKVNYVLEADIKGFFDNGFSDGVCLSVKSLVSVKLRYSIKHLCVKHI